MMTEVYEIVSEIWGSFRPKFGGPKKHEISARFRTTQQDSVNRKTALQTTDTPI